MPSCSKPRHGSTGNTTNQPGVCPDLHRTREHLLALLRMDPGEIGFAGVQTISSTEWEELLRTATLHGVSPLLYHRLGTARTSAGLPPKVLLELRRSYLHSSAQNMNLYNRLGTLLMRLQQDGIPVIPLKGAHLAEVVYGNRALRPMNDVDLLVHEKDVLRVETALLEIGFFPTECHRQITTDNYNFDYRLPDKELFVEVHWNLFSSGDRFRTDMSGQWARAGRATIAGVEVAVLCPEDLLVYLCLHTSKHLFETGIKPVCDIHETIRYYGQDMNWDQIRILCGQAGIANAVYLSLLISVVLMGTKVPMGLLKAIKPDDFDDRYLAMAQERIFTAEQRNVNGIQLSPNIASLCSSRSIFEKIGLFLSRAFPSRAEMSRQYPAPPDSLRIYCYYPIRIRDLLLRHGRQTWRLVRQEEGMQRLAGQEAACTPLKEWLLATAAAAEGGMNGAWSQVLKSYFLG